MGYLLETPQEPRHALRRITIRDTCYKALGARVIRHGLLADNDQRGKVRQKPYPGQREGQHRALEWITAPYKKKCPVQSGENIYTYTHTHRTEKLRSSVI